MKKVISLFLSLTMLLSIVSVVDFSAYASVQTGKCGTNITYSLDTSTGVLTISGTGDMDNYTDYLTSPFPNTSPFYNNSDVKSVIIENGITSIGDCVLFNCSSLTRVTIPNSVTSIGGKAFLYCCSLTSITIPDSVTSIGDDAFYECTRITRVTIPGSVTSIGARAFCDCTHLNTIEVSNDNKKYSSVDGVLFNKDVTELITYPAGKTKREYAVSNSVKTIGSYAFKDCTRLTSVTIPNGVTSIGEMAFYGCTNLTNATIGNSVTSISSRAFQNCTSLASVTIPNSVTSIGEYAFKGCTSLTSVTIPDSVTSIGEMAFFGCTSLTGVTISNSMTSIGKQVFYNCESLSNIIIPNRVTSIGDSAFSGCASLTSVTIPDSVTSIGYSAFSGCTSLTSITIPDSVTSIGYSVFYDCTNLEKVDYNGTVSQWKSISGYSNVSQIVKCSDNIIINENAVTINNLKYKINNDYTASLIGYIGTPENLTVPKTIFYAGFTFDVTNIGSSAFSGCTSLTSVTIQNSVTSIGSYAFYNCTSLESVNYSGTKSQWKAITIGSYNSYLTYAFIKCTDGIIGHGNTVTVDSVEYKLNDDYTARVISYSGAPENITISESVWYEGYTFKVTSIASAFDGCTSLTSITIPDSVTRIDNKAFYNCTSLTSVAIPNSVTSIGSYAFDGCTSLASVTIPDSVTRIGDYVFSGCTSLARVTIPNSVTSISSSAFYNCSNLKFVIYNGTVSQWKSISGYSNVSKIIKCTDGIIGNGNTVTIDNLKYQLNNDQTASLVGYTSSPENLVIPEKISCEGYIFAVTSIGDKAFYKCTNLTSVTIPSSVTSIGASAFEGCTSLTSVAIPNSVTSIGASAFEGCTNLASVTIPDSVTRIMDYAFYGCTSLKSVTIPNSITSIGYSAFYNCSNLKFVIYNGTKSKWNTINISSGNENLKKCIVKCTNGIIGNGNTVTIDNLKYQLNNDQTASLVGYTGSLENLVVPETIFYEKHTFAVTSIGDKAFYKCTSLTNVTIPESITTIGSLVFGSTGLQSVNYNGTKAEWRSITGSGNINLVIKCTDGICANSNNALVDGIKYTLEDDYTASVSAYYGNSQNIIIPESIEYVGCTFKVMYIAPSAFKDCTSITSVTIPNSVESIGDNAFQNCTSLTSITIPDSVISIASYVFNGCSKLKKIEIPDSVTYIGSKAFDGTAFYNTVRNWENGVLYCGNHLICAKSDVTKITVKASTVSIANGAFNDCNSLEKINVLNPKCVINCTIPKTAVIGGAEGSTAEDYAKKNNMSIDYFEECTHNDKVQVVIAATCTEQGAVQSRCADCDKLISQTFTAPLGHTMVVTTPAKAPTCTEIGYTQAGYCTVCGYNEASTSIPAAGHNFGSNSPNCLVCGVANPNYIAPTQPTQISKPVAKPKSASIKKVKAAKKAISVEWKKVSGVNGYEIQVATDKKFKKNKKTTTVKKQKTTKVTVKKLKAKKKYYVRMRTYKTINGKKVYSSWSKVKTVKTK